MGSNLVMRQAALRPGKIYVGTSGWSYRHWKGPFYPRDLPAKKQFAYYVERFNTVEINRSFYRLLTVNACKEWNVATPSDFAFVLKGSRFITHMKKLKDPAQALARFFTPITPLRKKVHVIVFQLPPFWGFNEQRFSDFLKALPRGFRYAFEFREPGWYNETTYALLRKHRAAFCIYELAGHHSPICVTTDFVYIRLHGPGEKKYQGLYGEKGLATWVASLKKWQAAGRDVYIYFDNDQEGYAVQDALTLKHLLTAPRQRS